MAATSPEIGLRIPSAAKVANLTESMGEDDFRFPRIKIQRDKPKYELPAPTADDPDNIVVQAGFTAVVLLARQNFYQSEEDKEEGKDPREKRELYLIRSDKVQPELVYVNPTSLNNWKKAIMEIKAAGESYYYCLINFGAEQAVSKTKGYKWNKLTFEVVRALTDAERSHVDLLRELVEGRVKQYVNQEELDNAEAEMIGVKRSPAALAPPAGGLAASRNSAPPVAEAPVRKLSVDDDDDDAGAFSDAAQTTPQQPAAKSPATTKKRPAAAAAEPTPAPAAKGTAKPGYPSLDGSDDDDEAPAPAAKTSPKANVVAGSLDDDDE